MQNFEQQDTFKLGSHLAFLKQGNPTTGVGTLHIKSTVEISGFFLTL